MRKRKRKPIEDKTRNQNFAAAFIYLKGKDSENFGTNILLAEKMGVDADTITNVIHCHTSVSESFIANLQKATGGIFNVHFLRGDSDVMLAKDLAPVSNQTPSTLDPTVTALLAAKDEIIKSLKRELIAKDEIIASKNALITAIQEQIDTFRFQSALEKGGLDSNHS